MDSDAANLEGDPSERHSKYAILPDFGYDCDEGTSGEDSPISDDEEYSYKGEESFHSEHHTSLSQSRGGMTDSEIKKYIGYKQRANVSIWVSLSKLILIKQVY
jgi:hypothetical protein